jgi:hypothetical protein
VGNLFAKEQGVEQEVLEESAVVRAPRRVEAVSAESKGVTERESVGREHENEDRSPLVKKQAERLVGREQFAVKEKAAAHGEMPARTEEIAERPVETRETVRPIETHTLLVQQPLVPERVERVEMGREEAEERESAERRVVQPLGERSGVERVPGVREQQRDGRRGSKEIQIHIGRIEVIAVPAPQQRAAAPASGRRPESLDEYLQRRDRRAR